MILLEMHTDAAGPYTVYPVKHHGMLESDEFKSFDEAVDRAYAIVHGHMSTSANIIAESDGKLHASVFETADDWGQRMVDKGYCTELKGGSNKGRYGK